MEWCSDGEVNWLHSDHLSSVGATTDRNGAVVGRQLFEPYGAVRAEFGEVDGSWGWAQFTQIMTATHRKAESHGLTFMRARWYDAGVGRFVQADTVVPDPTSAGAFNRYAYSNDNPLGLMHPTGHDAMFVGGFGTNDWEDPSEWKGWVKAYKGWDDKQWQDFLDAWTSKGADRDTLMKTHGIHFFQYDSWNATVDNTLVSELANQMSGMTDITLVGHSKGANMVTYYAQNYSGLDKATQFIGIDGPVESFVIKGCKCASIARDVTGVSGIFVNVYGEEDLINDKTNGVPLVGWIDSRLARQGQRVQ